MVKNLSAVQETQVRSLGWEDPLEKGMFTHSSMLAWRIPWTEEPGRIQSMGSQKVGPKELDRIGQLSLSPFPHCVHESIPYVCIYYCPENEFFSTIFLDSIYVCVCVCV